MMLGVKLLGREMNLDFLGVWVDLILGVFIGFFDLIFLLLVFCFLIGLGLGDLMGVG